MLGECTRQCTRLTGCDAVAQITGRWRDELVYVESAAVSDPNGPLPLAAVAVPVETNFLRHSAVSSQWVTSVEPAGRMRTTAQRLRAELWHLVSGIAGESVPGLSQFAIARVGLTGKVDRAVGLGQFGVDCTLSSWGIEQ